jgi:malate dehydrogenase (oxaloacetate-decarboxylating)
MRSHAVAAPWPVQAESIVVTKSGGDLLRDPLLNKGVAFTAEERLAFGLRGLLPGGEVSLEAQTRNEFEVITAKESPQAQLLHLAQLLDQNEQLFYRVLCDNLAQLMPVVYTPTVAWATRNFGKSYRPRRGLWLTPAHRGQMVDVLRATIAGRAVSLLVVTDNESILGIGDQGAGGIAISIGKLSLYTAGAGIPPSATLPVSLDVGTSNEALLDDEGYVGWRAPRLRGDAYDGFIDEFVTAVREVCPGALVQWEDFRKDSAERILARHRSSLPCFNDDIQGTGAVALAGILSACRITGCELEDHRIVVYGAGAAGLGIARQLRNALRLAGLSDESLHERLAVLDSRGLLVDDLPIAEDYKRELAWPVELANRLGLDTPGRRSLEAVVHAFRPTVLIGTSGQAGSFSEVVIREMAMQTERPVVMPFSNPTECAEASPADIVRWSDGRALIATGSPFPALDYDGRRIAVGQGNNVFIFPGLGLGALLARAGEISDTHVSSAAIALARHVSDDELERGQLFPSVDRLREISREVATAVISCIFEERGAAVDYTAIRAQVDTAMWRPHYPRYRLP